MRWFALTMLIVGCDRAPEPARITVRTSAPEAVLFVNAHEHGPLGEAGTEVSLLPGDHVLEARRAGAILASERIVVRAGERRSVTLTPALPTVPPSAPIAAPPLPDHLERSALEALGEPRPANDRSAASLTQVIRENRGALNACYQDELRREPNARPSIRLDLDLAIDPSGRVSRVDASGEAPESLRRCVVERARSWTFPPGEDETQIRFPVVFAGS